jgi:hypothetical protein
VIARVSTDLDCSADLAWDAVKRPETLRYITRGVLGFRPLAELPQQFGEGMTVPVRLLFFGVIPAWRHEITIVRLDPERRELYTNERGGPVRNWNHLIRIEAAAPGRARYTDEIEIQAGPLTPLVWSYAQLFYRYRQRRWRRLARALALSGGSQSAAGST